MPCMRVWRRTMLTPFFTGAVASHTCRILLFQTAGFVIEWSYSPKYIKQNGNKLYYFMPRGEKPCTKSYMSR
jgi:hypothetical protein